MSQLRDARGQFVSALGVTRTQRLRKRLLEDAVPPELRTPEPEQPRPDPTPAHPVTRAVSPTIPYGPRQTTPPADWIRTAIRLGHSGWAQ
jgi:hypothetical protein